MIILNIISVLFGTADCTRFSNQKLIIVESSHINDDEVAVATIIIKTLNEGAILLGKQLTYMEKIIQE